MHVGFIRVPLLLDALLRKTKNLRAPTTMDALMCYQFVVCNECLIKTHYRYKDAQHYVCFVDGLSDGTFH